MWFFAVDGWFIVVLLVFLAGGIYLLVKGIITTIILAVIAIPIGIIEGSIVLAVFVNVINLFRTTKNIIGKVGIILQGLIIIATGLILFIITIAFIDGLTGGDYSYAKYELLGSSDFNEKKVIGILAVIIAVNFILLTVGNILENKRRHASVWYIASIVLAIAVCNNSYKLTTKYIFDNAIQKFNLDTPTYVATEDVSVMNEFAMLFVETGTFDKGTQLYTSDNPNRVEMIHHIWGNVYSWESTYYRNSPRNVDYIEVTDGEKIGYVLREKLKKE